MPLPIQRPPLTKGMVDAYGVKGPTQFTLDEVVAPVAISLDVSSSPYQSTPAGIMARCPSAQDVNFTSGLRQMMGVRPTTEPISVLGIYFSGAIELFGTPPTGLTNPINAHLYQTVYRNIFAGSPGAGNRAEQPMYSIQDPGRPGAFGVGTFVTYDRPGNAVTYRANIDPLIAGASVIFEQLLGVKLALPADPVNANSRHHLEWIFPTPIHLHPIRGTGIDDSQAMDTLFFGPTDQDIRFDEVSFICQVWQTAG